MPNAFLDRVSNKALGQMLIEKGAVSDAQVNEALELSRTEGIRLGEALVQLGYVTRDALGYAIGEQYGLTPMELHPSMLDLELLSRFDYGLLCAHTMLPLIDMGSNLVVVVADPNNQQGLAALSRQWPEHTITPQIGAAEQINRCLDAIRPQLAQHQAASAGGPAGETAGLARQLQPVQGTPNPGDQNFLEWLLYLAVAQPCSDVLVRDLHDSLQVCLTPSVNMGDDNRDVAQEEKGMWQGSRTSDVLNDLLRQAGVIEYTRGQAARWSYTVSFDGKLFEILILTPILHGLPLIRLRALQRLDSHNDGIAIPLSPDLEAGRYTVVLYDKSVSLERALSQFMEENAARHSFLVCQYATRCVFPHAISYPAPFTDTVAAAQATAATCVIFDHPVEYREATGLLTSTYPPPAVLVCAPLPSHEGGAGSLSPDVEELINRQGAQSVRLMEPAENATANNIARGNE